MLNTDDERLVFELSRPGRRASSLPALDVPAAAERAIPAHLVRGAPRRGLAPLVAFPADLRAGSADEKVEIDAFVGL